MQIDFFKGVVNGTILSIPLWLLIIFGLKELLKWI